MKNLFVIIGLCLMSSKVFAGYSQDEGEVTRIYVSPQGAIALQLKNGFPNAKSTNQCPQNNGWAGLSTADSVLKSVIITAKSTGQELTVTVEGCNGAWFKIKDIYLN
jgi:hypothetical protein